MLNYCLDVFVCEWSLCWMRICVERNGDLLRTMIRTAMFLWTVYSLFRSNDYLFYNWILNCALAATHAKVIGFAVWQCFHWIVIYNLLHLQNSPWRILYMQLGVSANCSAMVCLAVCRTKRRYSAPFSYLKSVSASSGRQWEPCATDTSLKPVRRIPSHGLTWDWISSGVSGLPMGVLMIEQVGVDAHERT